MGAATCFQEVPFHRSIKGVPPRGQPSVQPTAIAEEPGPGTVSRDDVHSLYFVVRPDGGQLRELASLVDKGQLRPAVSAVFELGALPEAFLAQRAERPRAR
ncbi:MAG TPA: zinc-binding dehydrogenase [Streptosporangiaceae bacterium]